MFLKSTFGERCWHQPKRQANFIIDDPLLRETYGFLNYRRLLGEMDAHEFGSTTAFIPWNYKRSDPKVAKLFRDRADRLSICVHGCDHTQGEFASDDLPRLNYKVGLATQRIERHQQLTGVPFARAMVFPQGKFSSQAMKALKFNHYLAAVNSTAVALDLDDTEGLRIADYLELAVTTYHGFPLFLRRYPDAFISFAFDLFLGKPLLMVEHHEYFKEGYEKIGPVVRSLHALTENLQWKGLDEILTTTYWQKQVSERETHCKRQAHRQLIENSSEAPRQYQVFKSEMFLPPQSIP